MGKILGSWSGMRKYLEKEMLADCLKGRIRYECTAYPGMDGCHIIRIFIDDKHFKSFSMETVNTFFIDNGYKENSEPCGQGEYWKDYWNILDKTPITQRCEYTDEEFCEALEKYRNQNIKQSLESQNPLEIMFALFDRRVGKRTLESLKDKIEIFPEWIKNIYFLRIQKEKTKVKSDDNDI